MAGYMENNTSAQRRKGAKMSSRFTLRLGVFASKNFSKSQETN